MNLTLYRNGAVSCAFTLDDQTTVKRRLMVENTISVSVAVAKATPLDVRIGDYADMEGERYVVLDTPSYKLSNGVYDYSILLRGNVHRLEVYMMPDGGRDEWWYYGGPVQQIDKVVAMLNTKESGWSAVYPDLSDLADTSPKNLNYANMSILSALHAIASAENGWGLEFDIRGKVVRFARQLKTPTALRFEYGRGKGLYELTRGELSGEKLATRVVAYGASTNRPNGVRLSMAEVNNHLDYVDCRTELYGIRETRINYDHLYPRRNASITADAVQVEAGKANWTVIDATLDFDLNAQTTEGAVIVFNSGDCVGVEFEIVHYDPATKTITFKEYVDQSAAEPYVLPNANRSPKAGDAYILVNILMPDSYVAAAQRELQAAATVDVDRLSQPQYSYSVDCDPRFIRALPHRPVAGDACRIVDEPHGVDYTTRIVGVEYPLIDPTRVKLTLAEKVAIPSAVVLAKSVKEVKTKLGILDRGQLTEAELHRIFHPLGGSPLLNFAARDLTARKVEAPTIATPNYSPGAFGAGGALTEDPTSHESTLVVHNVVAKNGITAPKLTVRKMEATGGIVVVTAAYAELTRVEEGGSTWRCFYKCEGQLWRTGDQPRLQDGFGGYFWGLVTSVSDQPNEAGEYRFDLSKTTVASGTNIAPKAGDVLVLFGHRGLDTARQSVGVTSCGYDNEGEGGMPYQAQYVGINSFAITEANIKEWKGGRWELKVESLKLLGPDGLSTPVARDRGQWVGGTVYYRLDRVSHQRQIWLCLAPSEAGTVVEPTTESAEAGLWLLEVSKGEGWRYQTTRYRWTDEANPTKPVGVDSPGWVTNPVGGRVVCDHTGRPLTDEQGRWIVAPYPKAYRLWGSVGTFDGATDELIGLWGTPYPISAIDGKDGTDGKDVDPETVDKLYIEIDKMAQGFGFNTAEELSDYLKLPMGKIFEYNAATGILTLSTLIAQRIATDQAFVNKLVASQAFISQLLVDRLNTKPTQQTKRVEIKEDTVNIYDDVRLIATFNGSPMPPKSEFENDGASGSVSAGSVSVGVGQSQTLCSLVVTRANSTLRVQSHLWFHLDELGGAEPTFGAALLELWKDGALFVVIASNSTSDYTYPVDSSLPVPAGTYSLVLRCERYEGDRFTSMSGAASDTTLSFRYADDALLTMFTVDGYGMRVNKFSYEHTWFNPVTKQLEKTFKGKTDMPGLLGKARVGSDGFIYKPWGAYMIQQVENISAGGANKRVWHDAIAGEYSAICTAYGGGTAPIVYDETTDYVDVYATGSFNILLTGNNV